jgi:hypothetical protein
VIRLPPLEDATGQRYEPRALFLQLVDTVVRFVLLATALVVIGAAWQTFT